MVSAGLKVVEFPAQTVTDVAAGLRELAADIEAGEFGEAYNVVYVVDCGEQEIAVGLFGQAPEGGPTAYYLLGRGMRKLEG